MSSQSTYRPLICTICQDTPRDPCRIPCLHVFCREHLEQVIFERVSNGDRVFLCPNCRYAHDIMDTGAEAYPVAYVFRRRRQPQMQRNNAPMSDRNRRPSSGSQLTARLDHIMDRLDNIDNKLYLNNSPNRTPIHENNYPEYRYSIPDNNYPQNITPIPDNNYTQYRTPIPDNNYPQNITPIPDNNYTQYRTPIPDNNYPQNRYPLPVNRHYNNYIAEGQSNIETHESWNYQSNYQLTRRNQTMNDGGLRCMTSRSQTTFIDQRRSVFTRPFQPHRDYMPRGRFPPVRTNPRDNNS